MPEIDFLSVVPLPTFRGLPLALTATRALERWSDLVDGAAPPSTLKASERIDIVDECLDIVVPRVGMPAGFEFTGLSAADLRAALCAAPGYEDEQTALDSVLRGTPVDALREAGRKRIQRLRPRTALRQRRLWIPNGVGAGEDIVAPTVLFELLDAAQSPWAQMRRNRVVVELTSVGSTQNRRFPLRGIRYPVPVNERNAYYIVWDDCRLIPQSGVREPDYRENQLALPSSEVSYFSPHFPARNVFAHWRLSGFTNADGLRVAVLNEIQSDWIHDLRWQRLNKPISKRWIAGKNGKIDAIDSTKVTGAIPECPLAASWLQVAVDALVDDCRGWGADILAWTPGRIQHELNPALPLPTAQRLYDIHFPKCLERKLRRKVPEFHVDYPTHTRDVLLERQTNGRFVLWTPDQKSPVGQPLPDFDTALRAYRQHTRPVTEALPAVELLDFG